MYIEFDKQMKFYIKNMEKKISYLYMFVEIKLQKVAFMEKNVVFLRSKEFGCKNAI